MSGYSPHSPAWHSNCTSPRLAWRPSSPSPLTPRPRSETFRHNRCQYRTDSHVTAAATFQQTFFFFKPVQLHELFDGRLKMKHSRAYWECKPPSSLQWQPLIGCHYLDGSVHHHATDDLRLVGLLPLSSLNVTDYRSHVGPRWCRAGLGNLSPKVPAKTVRNILDEKKNMLTSSCNSILTIQDLNPPCDQGLHVLIYIHIRMLWV